MLDEPPLIVSGLARTLTRVRDLPVICKSLGDHVVQAQLLSDLNPPYVTSCYAGPYFFTASGSWYGLRRSPDPPIMITRSRKLSLKLVYQLTHKMMICRSKCRPLNRSSIGLNDCIPHHRPVKARLHQSPRNKVSSLVRDGKSKDDISKTLVSDFGWNPNG